MKNFSERLVYKGHRPCFYYKYAMVMAVCSGFGTKPANQYMRDIFTSFGFNVSDVYRDKYRADYQYYKDKTEHPYTGSINPFKKFASKRAVEKFSKEISENRL